MDLTFAHYRNRFCMFRTYYALAVGKLKVDGIHMKVVELPDPPSKEQEEALIRGDVQAANLYLPNFLRRKLQGAPIIGLATEWKSTMKGNGVFVCADGQSRRPKIEGRLVAASGLRNSSVSCGGFTTSTMKLRWESIRRKTTRRVMSGKADAGCSIILLRVK
jgi:hypothetical protein